MNFAELLQNLIYERDHLQRRIAELEAMKTNRHGVDSANTARDQWKSAFYKMDKQCGVAQAELVKVKKERDAARAELTKLKQQYPQALQSIIDHVEKLDKEWMGGPSGDLGEIAKRLKTVRTDCIMPHIIIT